MGVVSDGFVAAVGEGFRVFLPPKQAESGKDLPMWTREATPATLPLEGNS